MPSQHRLSLWLGILGILSALFAVTALSGCMGGTGTTTDNGITRSDTHEDNGVGLAMRFEQEDGHPAAGLRVRVFSANYNPVTAAAESVLVGKSDSLVTSSAGKLHLLFAKPGTFVVEASDSVGVVVLDTVWILNPGKKDSIRFRTEACKRFTGRITLESGLLLDSGWMMVRGTRAKARVDSLGRYDLGAWPSGLRARAGVLLDHYRVRPQSVVTGILVKDTGKANSILDTLPRPSDSPQSPSEVSIVLPIRVTSSSVPETLLTVRCADTAARDTGAACAKSDTAVYVTNKAGATSPDSAGWASDSLKPNVYLADGRALPACTASSALKSSDDLKPSATGEEGDFMVLDVSQSPTCLAP